MIDDCIICQGVINYSTLNRSQSEAADITVNRVKVPFGEEKFLLVEMKKNIRKHDILLLLLATTNRKIQDSQKNQVS